MYKRQVVTGPTVDSVCSATSSNDVVPALGADDVVSIARVDDVGALGSQNHIVTTGWQVTGPDVGGYMATIAKKFFGSVKFEQIERTAPTVVSMSGSTDRYHATVYVECLRSERVAEFGVVPEEQGFSLPRGTRAPKDRDAAV